MSDKVKVLDGTFTVNKVEGVATATFENKDAFYQGTEIPKKVFKEVHDHYENYTASAAKTAKEEAQRIMTEDKTINNVVVSMPYGVSKRGELNVLAKREHTYPGMNGSPDVVKSTLKITVKEPANKVSKPFIKEMEAEMTKALLNR